MKPKLQYTLAGFCVTHKHLTIHIKYHLGGKISISPFNFNFNDFENEVPKAKIKALSELLAYIANLDGLKEG